MRDARDKILLSLHALNVEQTQAVWDYIRNLTEVNPQQQDYNRFKSKALREIREALKFEVS